MTVLPSTHAWEGNCQSWKLWTSIPGAVKPCTCLSATAVGIETWPRGGALQALGHRLSSATGVAWRPSHPAPTVLLVPGLQDTVGEATDVPVLKLFEFLVASICLFMVEVRRLALSPCPTTLRSSNVHSRGQGPHAPWVPGLLCF